LWFLNFFVGELLTGIKIFSSISAPPECDTNLPADRVLRAQRNQPYLTVGRETFSPPFKGRHLKICQQTFKSSGTYLRLVQVKVYPPGKLKK